MPPDGVDLWFDKIVSLAADIRDLSIASRAAAVQSLLDLALGEIQGPMTVALIGERSRGKSSLVNAMAGRADLLPVDIDVATNVHTEVRFVADSDVAATVQFDDGRVAEIAPSTLASYVSERENPHNGLGVRVVRVRCPLPDGPNSGDVSTMGALVIIDTPGIGGPVAEHDDHAHEAIRSSDGVLYVLEAKKLASREELAFATRARETGVPVVFVAAKLDEVRGDPTVVLKQIQDALDERSTSLGSAPVVGVSAARWLRGLAATNPSSAARLFDGSGMQNLQAAIRDHLVRPFRHGLGTGLLETATLGLRELRSPDVEVVDAIERGAVLAKLESARNEIARLPNPVQLITTRMDAIDRRVRKQLQLDLRNLKNGLNREVKEKWSRTLAGRGIRRDLPERWRAGVEAAWSRALNDIAEQSTLLLDKTSRQYGLAGDNYSDNTETDDDDLGSRPIDVTPTKGPVKDQPSRSGRVAHWCYLVGFTVLTAGLGSGAAIGRHLNRTRLIKTADQQNALAWITESVEIAQDLFDELADHEKRHVKRLNTILGGRIRARGRALKDTIDQLEDYEKVDMTAARRRLAESDSLVQRARELGGQGL